MARLVLSVPGLTPKDYWELSNEETQALVDALKEQAKANKRRR